ncbi:MAG: geranylgeranyl reductase family protein [Methanomicrobia archaeon]|nr:geranylgeranyl reductase family protein [Methanomicrobia archaeon]
MKSYDVIVIGAGPAGATAAARVADSDLHTLLLEKEHLPRPKICGGAVSQRALSLLTAANLRLPELKTFRNCTSMQLGTFDLDSTANLATISFDTEAAYLTDRAEFDYALVQNAISNGVDVQQNVMATSITKEHAHFIITGDDFSAKATYLLCADGVNGTSASLLGFRDTWTADNVGLCIESTIMDYEPPPAPLNFYFGGVTWGYAWFFDKGHHASIGTGAVRTDASDLRRLFNSFVKHSGYTNAPENLKLNAWRIPATGGISGKIAKGNALLLGDAAGLVDPFLGEGISYAIQSGTIAADCIINNDVGDYRKRIEEAITSDLKYARILQKIVKLDPKRFVTLLAHDTAIAREYVKIIVGDSTYRQFLKNTFKQLVF